MIQPKSKLTIVLKIYSLAVLLFAGYLLTSIVISFIEAQVVPATVYVNYAEVFVLFAVSFILIWIIYTNRPASALFLPCLILSIVPVFVLSAYIVILLSSHLRFAIQTIAIERILSAVIFLLIAIDAKFGSKFALAELVTLAAFKVIAAIAAIVRVSIMMSGAISFGTLLSTQVVLIILNLIFSSSAIIVLFLLRTHIQRKKAACLPPQAGQIPQDI